MATKQEFTDNPCGTEGAEEVRGKKKEKEEPITLDQMNGFSERQARRMARNPCTHLWISLTVAVFISAVGMVIGDFSLSSNSGGWQSRGTMIADRQTQLLMIQQNQDSLFYGADSIWDDLINNVQPGWELDDDEEDRGGDRRLLEGVSRLGTSSSFLVEYLTVKTHRMTSTKERANAIPELPFHMTTEMNRRLQGLLPGCDTDIYAQTNLTQETRLWPIWKTHGSERSVLDPEVLHDICVAESNTQQHLEEQGLCFGCEDGCLPPFSIVLYARLVVPSGLALDCTELVNEWEAYQTGVEDEWQVCVEDVKEANKYPGSIGTSLPESCPPYFKPALVDEHFEVDKISTYTSSIFLTSESGVDALYEQVEHFDVGSNLVEGAYDTQYNDFNELYVDDILNRDVLVALGSSLVVATAIIIHTKSPFLTVMGLTQILLSFPLSYFVYKLVANLDFFPFLNFIGVFVVFALGAGDVFVAVDKWKNSRLEHPKAETEVVAALALPDAASAMFLTTLTTAVAFFATAICPVAPIKMFSVFCGLLIVFDYLMNILLVFPALCIYDMATTMGDGNPNCFMTLTAFTCYKEEPVDSQEIDSGDHKFEPKFIHRALSYYYDVVHRIRWPLLAFCVGALAVSTVFATTLELPNDSDVRLLSTDHEFELNYQWRPHLLSLALSNAHGSLTQVIWGVKPADTGIMNNPDSWSQLVLDTSFDPSSEDAQIFLNDFCDDFLEQDFALPVEEDFLCSIQKFDQWLEAQSTMAEPEEIYSSNCGGAVRIPVPSENFDSCMVSWSKNVNETAVLSREGKVTVMVLPFTSRTRYNDKYDVLDSEWKLIEDWMKAKNRQAPDGVSRGYFSSQDFWWYDTNGEMFQAALSAVGIALACSAVVVLFSSRSFVLTIFSTLTILYVLASVTAMLVGLGWTLGFQESICFAILIGVSVDFVIHFSHAYASLTGDVDRGVRTKHALLEMGPSILATAFTTTMSAVVMAFTVITFFQKFALILLFTILQASIGSFIFYVTTLDCVGPSDPTYLFDLWCREADKDENDEISTTMPHGEALAGGQEVSEEENA